MIIDGNNFIRHHLKNKIPFAAGKIGGNELQILYMYLTGRNPWGYQFIKEVEDGAGLYPAIKSNTDWFAKKLLDELKNINLLPAWSKVIPDFESKIFSEYCPSTYITKLQHLEPYFFNNPWTDYLEGKKVLVISPFSDSINNNYKVLEKIWKGKIKPNFNLQVVNYPASLSINKNSEYKNSQEIYNKYIEVIRNTDFDVGILVQVIQVYYLL